MVRYAPDDPQASRKRRIDVTPKDNNVWTRVHEYGGGAFQLHKGGGFCSPTLRRSGCISRSATVQATVVTDQAPDGQYRYADYDV